MEENRTCIMSYNIMSINIKYHFDKMQHLNQTIQVSNMTILFVC